MKFQPGPWQNEVNVRDFIQRNYTPFEGDAAFLAGPTPRTTRLWGRLSELFAAERDNGAFRILPNTSPAPRYALLGVRACELATTHGLRHTAASLAIAAGADLKALQRMIGHASATLTLDTYGHLYDTQLETVADALAAFVPAQLRAVPDLPADAVAVVPELSPAARQPTRKRA